MRAKRALPLTLVAVLLGTAACENKPEIDPAERHAQLMKQLDIAETRIRNNKLKDAQEIVDRVLKEIPTDGRALLAKGKLSFQQANLEEAEATLGKAIETNPENGEAHFILGQVLKHGERWDESAKSFGEAFRIDPERSDFGIQAGEVLNEGKRYGDAENVLRQVASLDPEAYDENNVGVHTHLADALRGQDKLDEALKMYMKAQNIYNSDKMARAGAAFIYEAQDKPARAIGEWSAYIQRDCCSEYSRTVAQKKIMELKVPPVDEAAAEGDAKPDKGDQAG